MEKTIITRSSDETEKTGEEFAKRLKPQDVIFLIGNLGAGKTTFAKGVARGLGVESRVISPTFVLLRSHKTRDSGQRTANSGQKIETLYHLDLYRLQTEKQSLDIGLKDIFEDESGVILIEWPEISQSLVNKKVWKVKFETLGVNKRRLEVIFE